MKRNALVAGLIAAGVITSGLAGYSLSGTPWLAHARAESTPALAPAPALTPPPASAIAALPDFSALVERNGPAVVNVTSVRNAHNDDGQLSQVDPDNPLFEFFRHFQIPMPQNRSPQRGLGSGFIVSPDGVILTNAHVVADATEVTVRLTDRREFRAKVVGIDKPTDVAVLKIEATNLPTVRVGDSKSIRVGEWVAAIGSPYGFENSVTSGIVSAKFRSLPSDTYVPFIQTDVAVNPGNSGGPLFNMKGEVIGINSQIYSTSGGYQGLSFAIPIDVAVKVKDELQQHGKVTRGRLGVTIQEVDQELANSFGLKQPGGALVASVERGGPAAAAGIEPGDVIVSFNGKPISRSSELPAEVADVKPGSKAQVEVMRQGKTRELGITIGELKQDRVAAADDSGVNHERLGVAVRPLTRDEQKQASVQGGLLVEQVGGAAARAGIQPGDVILALNGTPVHSVEQLRSAVDKSGKTVAVLVQREDTRIFVPIKLG